MLSYMLPVEEKSPTSRNLSLNLQNPNTVSQQSSDTDEHNPHDDLIDESTKLLTMEREFSGPRSNGGTNGTNGNGNILKNGDSSKIIYSNSNNNLNNNSIIKNGGNVTKDHESILNNNSNEETNCNIGDKRIIKMSKIGTKNVTLKR